MKNALDGSRLPQGIQSVHIETGIHALVIGGEGRVQPGFRLSLPEFRAGELFRRPRGL